MRRRCGPGGASEGGGAIELIGPSASQKKLGKLGDLGGKPLVGNRVMNIFHYGQGIRGWCDVLFLWL